jgi:PAS domain S-box-containing protein
MGNPDVDAEEPPSAYYNEADRRARLRRLGLGLFVAFSGIALSLLLSWSLREREQELAQTQFKIDAGERIEALQRIVVARLAKVNATAAFLRGSDVKDRKEFSTFVNEILRGQPSIQVLAWAPHVSAAQRHPHEQAVRNEGFPKYTISQRDEAGQLVAVVDRDEYYPLLFAEPLQRNQSLLGYDLGSDAAFRAAFHEAASTGRAAVANYVPWNSNKEADRSLLYVVEPARYESAPRAARPADQPEIDGFVLGVFHISALVEGSLDLFAPIGIDVYIARPAGKGGSTPVYTRLSSFHTGSDVAPPSGAGAASTPENLYLERDIDVANVLWTVKCVPTAFYLARRQTYLPLCTLLAGLFVTGLLWGYLRLLAGRTAWVERLVAERWRELRESEQRFRGLIDHAGDAFFLRTEQGKILDVNRRACESLGYTRKELLSMTIMDVDVSYGSTNLSQYSNLPPGEYPRTFEGAHRRKDGTTFPVEIRLAPLDANGQRLMLALVRDITDRKDAETALREEQRLLRDMLELQERDRKLVAYEIHDGLAQQLTAAVYNFQTVEVLHADPAAARAVFDEGLRLLRQSMAETRRLISGLRPPVLDEAGILAAVDYLIADHAEHGGPETEFVHEGNLERLAPPLEIAVFRIVQECLNNARRHSQSKRVRVELRPIDGRLRIDVQDWGIGFDPAAVQGEHFGLQGIHERARLLGGTVTIQTAAQHGTHITVELPLVSPAQNRTPRGDDEKARQGG